MTLLHQLKDVAEHFGVRPHTVSRWKKAGCPALKEPPFDLDAIDAWKRRQDHGNSVPINPESAKLSERKLRADIRLKEMKSKLAEFQLAVKRGELVHVEGTREVLLRQALEFRREIVNLENVHADKLIGLPTRADVKLKLHEIAVDLLSRLSLDQASELVCPQCGFTLGKESS